MIEIKNNYLYLLHNRLTNLYKIGIAEDLQERISRLETSSGMGLHLCASVEYDIYYRNGKLEINDSENKHHEMLCHKKFHGKRIIGEWFRFSKRDLVTLKNYIQNDLSELEINIFKI